MDFGEGATRMRRELSQQGNPFGAMKDEEILREYGRWHREVYLHDIHKESKKQYSHGNFDNGHLLKLLKNPRLLAEEYANSASTEAGMAKPFLDYWENQQ